MKDNDIVISRVIDAPQKKVFDAWTQPKQVQKWWPPETFTAPSIQLDLKVGGKYLYCMQGPDGKKFWSAGVFEEIVKPKRVVVTDYFSDEKGNKIDPADVFGEIPDVSEDVLDNFPKESKVVVTFEDIGDKTKLTIHYSPKTATEKKAMLDARMLEGWNSSLDNLTRLVES